MRGLNAIYIRRTRGSINATMISQSESVIYINVMTHFYDICSSIALPMY